VKNKVIISGCSYSAFMAGNSEIYPIILKRIYGHDLFSKILNKHIENEFEGLKNIVNSLI